MALTVQLAAHGYVTLCTTGVPLVSLGSVGINTALGLPGGYNPNGGSGPVANNGFDHSGNPDEIPPAEPASCS